jgi:hypothetical protein
MLHNMVSASKGRFTILLLGLSVIYDINIVITLDVKLYALQIMPVPYLLLHCKRNYANIRVWLIANSTFLVILESESNSIYASLRTLLVFSRIWTRNHVDPKIHIRTPWIILYRRYGSKVSNVLDFLILSNCSRSRGFICNREIQSVTSTPFFIEGSH